MHEFFNREFGQHFSLIVHDAHGVDRNVEAPGRSRNGISVRVNGLWIQDIHLGRLDSTAYRGNVAGHSVKFGLRATGEKDSRSFPGEYSCDGTANSATTSVDHSIFLVQH